MGASDGTDALSDAANGMVDMSQNAGGETNDRLLAEFIDHRIITIGPPLEIGLKPPMGKILRPE